MFWRKMINRVETQMAVTYRIKQRTKRVLQSMVMRLPPGARLAALDALAERMGMDQRVLTRQAARANIGGFLVEGEWGRFQSAIEDQMILPIYARSGTWARRTNVELIAFFEGRSGTYIDAGANIGLTTVPVAQNAKVPLHCIRTRSNELPKSPRQCMPQCSKWRHHYVSIRSIRPRSDIAIWPCE